MARLVEHASRKPAQLSGSQQQRVAPARALVGHGRGANLLMYNTDVVKGAPDRWGAAFPGAPEYRGKVTA